ncbi:MAG: glycosyltransferase family 4 protein [Porphyromonadaceae bacterium]|nr:glycosyltransferase family 4 protein [Porphyromonadaceae bacterium]
MVIAYCLQGLYVRGGVERIVTLKANYWAERGHRVYILVTEGEGRPLAFDLSELVEVVNLNIDYRADFALSAWRRQLRLGQKKRLHRRLLEEFCARTSPDIVVSTFFEEATILPSLTDSSRKVLELHTSRPFYTLRYPPHLGWRRYFGRLQSWLRGRTARSYDHFVVLTPSEMKEWGEVQRISAIPNPMSMQAEWGDRYEAKRVIAVGRFEYEKNFSALIDIWARVAQRYRDWTLELVGSGYLRGAYEQQITALELEGRVVLTEPSSAIEQKYQASSIIAMTSRVEGFGMVLIEGMSQGLPAVAFDCPNGPRDIICDGEDGFLLPMGDTQGFVDRLSRLIEDRELYERLSRQAVCSAQRFAQERVFPMWEQLFTQLLDSEV